VHGVCASYNQNWKVKSFYSLFVSLFTVLRVDETEKRSKSELFIKMYFICITVFVHMKQNTYISVRSKIRSIQTLSDKNSLHCLEIIMECD
jgi:hypothetical protein